MSRRGCQVLTLEQAVNHNGEFWSMRYLTDSHGVHHPMDRAGRVGPAVAKRGRWHVPVQFLYANDVKGNAWDLTSDNAKYWCTDTNWEIEHLLFEGLDL